MRIIFFGTPDYTLPILEALHAKFNRGKTERELVAVVTQPPKIVGKSEFKEYSAVDKFAYEHKIEVIYNPSDIGEADLGICASFGKIIPNETLAKFRLGILNVHPSPLPMFRGASPIQATLFAGFKETEITIIKMDEQMDHGPVVARMKSEVKDDDTNETLRARLFAESVPLLISTLPAYIAGKITPKKQNENGAVFTNILKKTDGYIDLSDITLAMNGKTGATTSSPIIVGLDFEMDAEKIDRLVKAMDPWPGVWTRVVIEGESKILKILKTKVVSGKLLIEQVQLEGKNPVTFKQFNEGYPQAMPGGN